MERGKEAEGEGEGRSVPAHLQNGAQGKQTFGRALPLDVDDFRQAIVGLLRLVDFQIQHTDFCKHLRVLRGETEGGREEEV